jgi:hypothetical protein
VLAGLLQSPCEQAAGEASADDQVGCVV